MEIRTLITFQKIAELGSFSEAANQLGYSQSTVTMQIKQLETELKVLLFNRIGRRITLTSEGFLFLKHANAIIRESQNARDALLQKTEPYGQLRIGILESICSSLLPDLLQRYHTLYPEVTTIIKIGTFDELSQLLNSDQIDLLWIFDHPISDPGWIKVCTYQSPITIVCSNEHMLKNLPFVSLHDLEGIPLILTENDCSYRTDFLNRLSATGVSPTIFLEIGSTDIIKKFVEAGLGIAILPKYTLQPELVSKQLHVLTISDYQLTMYGQIFYHKAKWLSPSLSCFFNLIKEQLIH